MNKFTLQALALTGILAVSGLPAFAADMAPVSPAPNASVSTDTKAKVGTSADKTKGSVVKNVDKSKSATEKKIDKTSKNTKDKVHQQTAAKPVTPVVPSVSGSAGANAAVGNTGVNASTGVNVH
jgi:septal ring-binding cell division protein DamX